MKAIRFLNYLKENRFTLGAVESVTGGLFAAELCDIPGASAVFRGSLVTYANEVKIDVLGLDYRLIDQYGVVSREVAKAMAERGAQLLQCDICVSFTGNAGPQTLNNLPVGRIYMGIRFRDKTNIYELQLGGSRNRIRRRATELAREEIARLVARDPKKS